MDDTNIRVKFHFHLHPTNKNSPFIICFSICLVYLF